MRVFKFMFLAVAAVVAGCGTYGGNDESLTASVTVFHSLNLPVIEIDEEAVYDPSATVPVMPVIAKSFAIIPLSDAQNASLEYDTYARQLALILEASNHPGLKMTSVPDAKKADVLVTMTYGISDGKDRLVSTPVVGQTGGGGTTYHSGTASAYGSGGSAYGSYSGTSYTAPSFGVVGMNTFTVTDFTRGIIIRAYDARGYVKDKTKPIYEAKVFSTGYTGNIAVVMPAMLRAFGVVYPGVSGSTETIEASISGNN